MITADTVRSLPFPTDLQWRAFTEHLITVHSWYKHLPLFGGGEFVIFMAPDAGYNYPTQHPKLPTENTVTGYRRAFGHLDYIYRANPHCPFDRDGPPVLQLDAEVFNIGKFTLYPYVSHEFYWSVHEHDVARIRNGAEHPHAAAILDAYDAEQRMDQCWNELSDSDRERIVFIDECDSEIDERTLSGQLIQYLELQENARISYCKLQEPEIIKIMRRVESVKKWLA